MNTISTQAVKSLPVIFWQNQPVITTELLASVYGVQEKQIRQNFANNSARFVGGTHCFRITGSNLKEFRHSVENFDSVVIGKNANALMLWTERGTVRHAKMLGTDKAWEVQDELETFYFTHKTKSPEPPFLTYSTPEQRKPLVNAIRQLSIIATEQGNKAISYDRAFKLVTLQMGKGKFEELTVDDLPEALKIVGSMLRKVVLEGEYIAKNEQQEPAHSPTDYLSTEYTLGLENLIFKLYDTFHLESSFKIAINLRLLQATGVSPNHYTKKHLPIIANQLNQIMAITQTIQKNNILFELDALKRLVLSVK